MDKPDEQNGRVDLENISSVKIDTSRPQLSQGHGKKRRQIKILSCT